MSKSKVFIFIALSFAVGVLLASAFVIPREFVYLFLAVCAIGFAMAFINQKKIVILIALFLFCLGLGALRLQVSIAPSQFTNLLDNKQSLEGYITEDVDIRANEQLITFKPDGFSQNMQLTTTLAQNYFYGDRVVVMGKPEEAKNFGNFDYQSYLHRYNIYALMDYPQILILKSHQLNPVKEFLLRIKAAFSSKINNLFDQPQGALLLAILLGDKGTLPQQIITDFSKTGASHIIAVDGYKVTIIVSLLASLAYLIGRRAGFWLAIIALTSFVIITGAPASVLRAAIMGILLIFSLNIGRQYSIIPALFFAALIMLIVNPKILFWDVGFQLSFAATLGIVYFLPVLNTLTEKIPEFLGIKKLTLITLAAVISTMPFILLDFGILSLSAPLVNVLIMPILPFTMLFGAFAALPFIGLGFAFLANWLLLYILKITHFFAMLPYASLGFTISTLVFWSLIVGVFGLYFGLRYLAKRKSANDYSPFSGIVV
jgi:competence protein ComEC